MNISLTRVFLPLLLVLAFVVRWEPTRTLRLAPDERSLGESRWLIDDPDTCQHLRRIELAIATDKVVSFDRFVNYPDGGEIPALPLYDTMVAGIAQRFLRSPSGDVALGNVDEADLEDLAIKLAPILGLLMVLATWIAARNLVSGPRGDAAALVAAAVVALYPACVSVSSAGTLAPISLACVLFALLIRSIVRCVSAEAMPGALLDAMVGGALAGLLCTCTSLGILLFAPAWIALFVHAVRSREEVRARALRAGLLFCLVAAFLARMPLNEGPWEEGAGVVRGFAAGVSMIVFLSLAPFVVMLLLTRDEKQRAFRTLCFVAALVLMIWQVPQLWRDLGPAARWYLANHGLVDTVHGETARRGPMAWYFAFVAAIVAASWVWRDRRAPASLVVLLFAAVPAGLAVLFDPAKPLVIVASACLIARAVDMGFSAVGSAQARFAARTAMVLPAALLVSTAWSSFKAFDRSLREERIEFVAGLRWMRAHTESGGAWNSPRSESSWGVFSTIADGPLVEYHARRPAIALPWGVLSGARSLEETARGWWLDAPKLERFLQGQRVRYLVLAARGERWHRDYSIVDDTPQSATLPRTELARSTLDSASAPAGNSASVGAFERVYASARLIDRRGHATTEGDAKPVIAIWKLNGSAVVPLQPSMSPR